MLMDMREGVADRVKAGEIQGIHVGDQRLGAKTESKKEVECPAQRRESRFEVESRKCCMFIFGDHGADAVLQTPC